MGAEALRFYRFRLSLSEVMAIAISFTIWPCDSSILKGSLKIPAIA